MHLGDRSEVESRDEGEANRAVLRPDPDYKMDSATALNCRGGGGDLSFCIRGPQPWDPASGYCGKDIVILHPGIVGRT